MTDNNLPKETNASRMRLYITFGQVHAHHVNGTTFDKDSICEIECDDYGHGREIAFAAFGDKFATSYREDDLQEIMHYFPRGVIPLEPRP